MCAELGGVVRSVLDRSDREHIRLHQPRYANASAFGLRGYVDNTLPLVAMHHHDLTYAYEIFEITTFANSGIRA